MSIKEHKMWQSPWRYRESIAIVLGIMVTGFILQLTVGKFNFFLMHHPISIVLAVAIPTIAIAITLIWRSSRFIRWFTSLHLSITIIVAILILSLIMGLTPQVVGETDQREIFTLLGFRQMTSSWSFVLIYLLLLLSLGALTVRRMTRFKWSDYIFYLNHLGLWLILFAGGVGAADIERYVMHIGIGEVEWRVYDQSGQVLDLEEIAIELKSFDMEVYPPKLTVIDRVSGTPQPERRPNYHQIDPNRPKGRLADWNIVVDEYIHNAIRSGDSTYRAVDMAGGTPAARVSAQRKEGGEVVSGWVCGGNAAQLYRALMLDSEYGLVMTEPEPRSFSSDIIAYTRNGERKEALLEVNKPLRIGSWTIYQYGYDNKAGRMSSYSSMELVYDPWLGGVYAGIALLSLGCIALLWSGGRKKTTQKKDELE